MNPITLPAGVVEAIRRTADDLVSGGGQIPVYAEYKRECIEASARENLDEYPVEFGPLPDGTESFATISWDSMYPRQVRVDVALYSVDGERTDLEVALVVLLDEDNKCCVESVRVP